MNYSVTVKDLERFWTKVIKLPNGCWEWQGIRYEGYGHFYVGCSKGRIKKMTPAHRFAYELLVGVVPEGMELDHLCRNRGCVNPSHVEPVAHIENCRRGEGPTKTHCPQGHPYDLINTWFKPARQNRNSYRICRICDKMHKANHRKKQALLSTE